MDEWEQEDFEPKVTPGAPVTDKWEGEDEEEDVKDNWEDEDDEKKPDEPKQEEHQKPATTAYQRPKKKPIGERLAEKSRAKQEEEKQEKELTPEEKLAEKIRLQKIQEEADLKLAKGLFGVDHVGIDSMYPETKEQFDQFEQALKTKITFFEGSKLYPAFIEKLINDITLTMAADDVKKIANSVTVLFHEKERQRKEQAKNQKKKKAKATIRMDKDDMGLADMGDGTYYDDDDDDFI
ncbi:eukaryotic translation initiation factor 3 subunit J-like isoform X2 [Biomphalaria glabrata]|uniref:Eukaryotic translation initiation factor 3 subunit J n=1 Tax=Biomphalaria glabrata TaxID=6526 RepID=A0A9U8EGQ1_BIOGL|nr:eukaryotic translation initiation factor 3 subunit J-like [Biomphalaria glabrata]KAI8755847.1 eukaryotic translation initiation factor 3 subunit J-like isoform X2 [Biomphalaria glabrata]KAI8793368.1 eukaryotic translation initiation factor 3 subunit J isoform X2 [Biomphalaria glabrata]